MSNSRLIVPKYLLWGILVLIYSTPSFQAKPLSPSLSEEVSSDALEQFKTSTIPLERYNETIITTSDECRSPKMFSPSPGVHVDNRMVIYVACTAGGGILKMSGIYTQVKSPTKLNTLPQCDIAVHDIQFIREELYATCGTPDNLIIVRIDFTRPIPGPTPTPTPIPVKSMRAGVPQ